MLQDSTGKAFGGSGLPGSLNLGDFDYLHFLYISDDSGGWPSAMGDIGSMSSETAVPEPSLILLLGIGVGAAGLVASRLRA
jgi:hypothetical protein